MRKVLVLLASYNGERYIREQIDSLLAQKEVELQLLVRDDGSKDSTISILEEYQRLHDNIRIIKGVNVGPARSFLELLKEAETETADYFAFCDQDDVWLEDKLITAVKVLDGRQSIPALYMSAFQMVDENLVELPTRIKKPRLCLPSALVCNCATGCTMVFNEKLREDVSGAPYDDIIMHDYWMYLVCLVRKGFIYYDLTPHILYRQHSHNVIGGKEDSFAVRWSVRLKKLFEPSRNYKSKLAIKLLAYQNGFIDEKDKKFLSAAATPSKFSSKIRLICTDGVLSFSLDKNLQTLGLVISGKF